MNAKIFVAAAIVLSLLGLVGVALSQLGGNLVYYWTPSELLDAGDGAYQADVRLGGMVKAGSVQWDEKTTDLRFVVFDKGHEVEVQGKGMPPQMFREGIGVVVEGQLGKDGVFHSSRVLVKHDNQYKVPDEEHPDVEQLMQTMDAT